MKRKLPKKRKTRKVFSVKKVRPVKSREAGILALPKLFNGAQRFFAWPENYLKRFKKKFKKLIRKPLRKFYKKPKASAVVYFTDVATSLRELSFFVEYSVESLFNQLRETAVPYFKESAFNLSELFFTAVFSCQVAFYKAARHCEEAAADEAIPTIRDCFVGWLAMTREKFFAMTRARLLRLRLAMTEFAKREVTIFKNFNFTFLFRPYLAMQGAVVFSALLFLFITLGTIIFPALKITETQFIKTAQIKPKLVF